MGLASVVLSRKELRDGMETDGVQESLSFMKKGIWRGISVEGKGLLLGLVIGVMVGLTGGLFYRTLQWSAGVRENFPWLIFGLPVVGLLIVWMYRRGGEATTGGTNLVIRGARGEKRVSKLLAPLIFCATVLTNLFGGSAGREGAALQLGGSLAAGLSRKLRLSATLSHMAVICGMAAGFSALFGSKISAVVFALEISCMGFLCVETLLPCLVASVAAGTVSAWLGGHAVAFAIPEVSMEGLSLRSVILGLLCGLLSIVVCHTLEGAKSLMAKAFRNEYVRVAAGGCFILIFTLVLGNQVYLGAGQNLMTQAVQLGSARPTDFVLKLLFTAVTLSVGYKGGEIVPVFAIGATFGCVAAPLLGLPPQLGAAIGMIALFCGVTNCPVTSLMLGLEVFGFANPVCFFVAVTASFFASGREGLYAKPKFSCFTLTALDGKLHEAIRRRRDARTSVPLREKVS